MNVSAGIKDEIDCFNRRSIRPLEKAALLQLMEWRNSQMDVLRQSRRLNEDDQLRWWQSLSCDSSQVLFGLYFGEESPELIGYGGLVYLNQDCRRSEISFLVSPNRVADPELYRADFISALVMFSRYAFGNLGLHKIYTETFAFRERHIGILEEFGFQLEGRMRDHVFKQGQFFDSLIHSMLELEWKDITSELGNGLER